MEPEGCRRGSNEEGRVEELTRITKTPKWQRAPGERVTARSAAKSARHEGGEKVYLLTTSPRESLRFSSFSGKSGPRIADHRGIRGRTEKQQQSEC